MASTSYGNVTSAGWQETLCHDPLWHVSSRSGELLYSVYLYFHLSSPYRYRSNYSDRLRVTRVEIRYRSNQDKPDISTE